MSSIPTRRTFMREYTRVARTHASGREVVAYRFIDELAIDESAGSVHFFQLDPRVVLLEDLFVRRAIECHAVSADLAHADAVAPAAAEDAHADDRAACVSLDVEGEQAVAQAEQRAQPQRRDAAACGGADDFGGHRAF